MARDDRSRLGILLALVGGMLAVLYGSLVIAEADTTPNPLAAVVGVLVAVVVVLGSDRVGLGSDTEIDLEVGSDSRPSFPIGGVAVGDSLPFVIG